MRVEPGRLVVSRKNLLTLLAKLDVNVATPGTSAVEILDPDGWCSLHAEEDAVHYDPVTRAGHAPFPGPMHPREEAVLAEWRPPLRGQPAEYRS